MPDGLTLGKKIARARKAKTLSLKELADKVYKEEGGSVSPQYLNDIEHGRRVPSSFVMRELANQLALNLDELSLLAGQQPKDVTEFIKSDPNAVNLVAKAFRKALDSARKNQ